MCPPCVVLGISQVAITHCCAHLEFGFLLLLLELFLLALGELAFEVALSHGLVVLLETGRGHRVASWITMNLTHTYTPYNQIVHLTSWGFIST